MHPCFRELHVGVEDICGDGVCGVMSHHCDLTLYVLLLNFFSFERNWAVFDVNYVCDL